MNYEVRTPNSVENTGLDRAIFATREEAEAALETMLSSRDLSAYQKSQCGVVETRNDANTTFKAWNEAAW